MIDQPQALLLTLLLELPVIFLAARYWQRPLWRAGLAGVLASGLSHPLAWKIMLQMPTDVYRWGWYVLETGVCLFEAVILKSLLHLSGSQALRLSLMANILSAVLGRLLLALL